MTELKNYPREYEYVFTDKEKINKKCSFDKISFLEDTPKTIEEYIKLMSTTYDEMEKKIFDSLVKIIWLGQRFYYNGKVCNKFLGSINYSLHIAFKTFLMNYVGRNRSFWFHGSGNNFKFVVSYFNDFFPYFLKGNPFDGGYEYPYQYMKFESLGLVYQMPERLELLAYGEEKKMSMVEFLDYVLNYINCYNEEKKELIYEFAWFVQNYKQHQRTINIPYVKYKFYKNRMTGEFIYIKKDKK